VQFGEAHAGGVEQLDDGVVARAAQRVVGRAILGDVEKAFDFEAREPAGSVFSSFGARTARPGSVDDILAVQVPEEAAHGRQLAGDAASRESAAGELRQPCAQREPVHAAQVHDSPSW
jgi:hypothetical protein